MGYSCSRKAERDLKSNVSGLIKKNFVLKVERDFKELLGKNVVKGLGERSFDISCFMERY